MHDSAARRGELRYCSEDFWHRSERNKGTVQEDYGTVQMLILHYDNPNLLRSQERAASCLLRVLEEVNEEPDRGGARTGLNLPKRWREEKKSMSW